MKHQEKAKEVFGSYAENTVHFTSDGVPFFSANAAENHARTLEDKEVTLVHRHQVMTSKAPKIANGEDTDIDGDGKKDKSAKGKTAKGKDAKAAKSKADKKADKPEVIAEPQQEIENVDDDEPEDEIDDTNDAETEGAESEEQEG